MADPASQYSQNTSIDAKVFVDETASKIKDGLGKISDALQSGAKTASLKIKSAFEKKDLPNAPTAKPTTATSPAGVKAAKAADKFGGALIFPGDMKYYTKFTFKAYDKKVVNSGAKNLETIVIILPMPTNLKESFSVQYDTPALGPAVGGLAEGASNAARGKLDLPTSAGQGASQAVSGGQAIIQDLTKKAAGETAGAVSSMLSGAAPNPKIATIFSNINMRSHSFSYKFSPKSLKEVNDLRKIIYELKKRMLPGMSNDGNALFTFPDVCNIEFGQGGKSLNKPYKILECVMESIDVNYAPSGSPAFFKDGDAVLIEISMQFKETAPFTRTELGEFKDTTGVIPLSGISVPRVEVLDSIPARLRR